MLSIADLLEGVATPAGLDWLRGAVDDAAASPRRVPLSLPQLPRRIGRGYLSAELRRLGSARIDTGAWRACDAAALELLTAGGDPDPELLVDLYSHGDSEERTMVLRCLQVLPISSATGRLLGQVQRTNQVNHVAAATLDSNLLARALDDGDAATSGFGPAEFERLMLKLAFLDLPLERMLDAETHATPELSRMLQGLATEREAAGRKVWAGTNRVIGHAPTAGTLPRLLGGLEHGDDAHRLAAVQGLTALSQRDPSHRELLRGLLADRAAREDRPQIRHALERALAGVNGA
ncbi:MAG: EboA domain-containing protein [Planctomycetes bacterium]|nr:EboA domain-containing protein [Planctomycetota bacterium]